MKRKKSIILSLENIDFKYQKRKGVVLISSVVLLVIVSVLTISIMSMSHSSLSRIKKVINTSERFYNERIAVESLFNYTVALLVKNQDGVSWSFSISGDMKDLLDNWKGYVEDKLPGESQKWIDIYNQILSTNQVKNISQSFNFQSFVNEYKSYYQDSSFDLDQIIENLKIGVFRVSNTGGGKELILINYGKEFFWAVKIQKTLNQYLFLTNKETTSNGNPIYFVSGDVIDGPLYTTDKIHISGNPVFKGEVVARGIEQTEGSSPTFENGFSTLNENENYFTLNEDFANQMMNEYENKTENIEEILSNPPSNPTGIYFNTNSQVYLDFHYVDENSSYIIVRYGGNPKYKITYTANADGSMTATIKRMSGGDPVTIPFNGIILSKKDMHVGENGSYGYRDILVQSENVLSSYKTDLWEAGLYQYSAQLSNYIFELYHLITEWDMIVHPWYTEEAAAEYAEGKLNHLINRFDALIDYINYSSSTVDEDSRSILDNLTNDVRDLQNTMKGFITGSTGTSNASYVAGMLTLASKRNIYIGGNIVYSKLRKNDGTFETDADKYKQLMEETDYQKINLVAYNDVIMNKDVPKDLYITASIYALTGKFTLEQYQRVKKHKLNVYGAIIQKNRGPIGTFGGWRGSTGFKKHYVYDPRLYDGPYPEGTPSMSGKARIVDIR